MGSKRAFPFVLILLLLVGLAVMLPTAAMAAATSYLDENGNLLTSPATTDDYTGQTALGTASTTTWYAVTGTQTPGSRITVTGDVHIILADNSHLDASNGGITVENANSLTIYAQSTGTSMGKLTATDNFGGRAGIGRLYTAGSFSAGNITITGGNITATGGDYGAGIGGSGTYGVGRDGGNITISGGRVNAQGGNNGAGSGGGGCNTGTAGPGGNITISGGTVNAQGSNNGAGIGGGGCNAGSGGVGSHGYILIYGETTSVTATKGTTNTGQEDIGCGGGASISGAISVFVALLQGNLKNGSGNIGNPVTFSAMPGSAGTVTAELPAPWSRTVNILTGLDTIEKPCRSSPF